MRILFFERKTSPFFLTLDIPENRDLDWIDHNSETIKKIFQRPDVPVRLGREALIQETAVFLQNHSPPKRKRVAKTVWMIYDSGFSTCGSSVIGFKISGISCIASVHSNGCEIEFNKDGKRQRLFFTTKEYKFDDGKLLVEFSKKSTLYDFMAALNEALSPLKVKNIWALLES